MWIWIGSCEVAKYQNLRSKVDQSLREGEDLAIVIQYLHDSGVTIVDCMRVLVESAGLSLGEAKALVCAQTCWAGVVRAAEPLHAEILRDSVPK